jgi:NAD(P)H-flavin reductase
VISCFKNLEEAFLREDFFKLTHYWCLKHHIFLSRDAENAIIPPRNGEKIHEEKLNLENFTQLLQELKFFDPKRTQVLISGRESFVNFCKSLAAENGYKKIEEI